MRVALIGYPNVGKSTLFNRLLGRREAIVGAQPGLTRDRKEGVCALGSSQLTLIDTGGVGLEDEDGLGGAVGKQALAAVARADLVALVVDGRVGLRPGEQELAVRLRAAGKPVLVVVNKCERERERLASAEFHGLGLGEPIPVSAAHGDGIAELVERLLGLAGDHPQPQPQTDEQPLRLAILGRPNVGKSSLLNHLLGEERVVVSPQAGTTRDAIETPLRFADRQLVLVDTAGLRRAAKRDRQLERAAAARSLAAARDADLALIVCDASEGITAQDLRIGAAAMERGCATVVVINKWDLVRGPSRPALADARALVGARLRQRPQVVPVSAATGFGVRRLAEAVVGVGERSRLRVQTAELNRAVAELAARRPAPLVAGSGARLKILYGSQVASGPPRFVFWVNSRRLARRDYLYYLENRLRDRYGLQGVPVLIELRDRQQAGARRGGAALTSKAAPQPVAEEAR